MFPCNYLTRNSISLINLVRRTNYLQNNLKYGFSGYVHNNRLLNIRLLCNNTVLNNDHQQLETVYLGPLSRQIKSVKIISFSTSVCGVLLQPMLWRELSQLENGLPIFVGVFSVIGFFTFVTPILLHLVAKKYVTQLDFDNETKKYTATVLSFFCTKQKIEFSLDDIKVPDVPGMFTTFHAKGHALFVDAKMFKNPSHYGKIMGYDKPMDFKLYNTEETSSKTTKR